MTHHHTFIKRTSLTSPIHISCLIPEGVYSHSPLSVFEVVVAAGASTEGYTRLKIPAIDGKRVPADPYCMAAYARNAAIIRHMNGPMSPLLKQPFSWLNYSAVGHRLGHAFTLACSNVNTGGPFISMIPEKAYPRLREIYLERTTIGAAARRATIKAILELEKKCRLFDGRVDDGVPYYCFLPDYRDMVKMAMDVLDRAYSNSVAEKENDKQLIQEVLETWGPGSS